FVGMLVTYGLLMSAGAQLRPFGASVGFLTMASVVAALNFVVLRASTLSMDASAPPGGSRRALAIAGSRASLALVVVGCGSVLLLSKWSQGSRFVWAEIWPP